MNNPMVILIGLAIAAVGTLVAVNVVLPLLARAEGQAMSSEVNTLAGAMWEAKRQRLTITSTDNFKHMLSGWKCDSTTECDNSQIDDGFEIVAGGFLVKFKAGSDEACLNTATFLARLNSPFFKVLQTKTGTGHDIAATADPTKFWDGTTISQVTGSTSQDGCGNSTAPTLAIQLL